MFGWCPLQREEELLKTRGLNHPRGLKRIARRDLKKSYSVGDDASCCRKGWSSVERLELRYYDELDHRFVPLTQRLIIQMPARWSLEGSTSSEFNNKTDLRETAIYSYNLNQASNSWNSPAVSIIKWSFIIPRLLLLEWLLLLQHVSKFYTRSHTDISLTRNCFFKSRLLINRHIIWAQTIVKNL